MPTAPRLRFAPSPTGYLHVGGARAVLFNWLYARQQGGQFLLRIEDTDTERNQPELIADILDSIRWLGLAWDGEPVHQSDHRARHLEVAEQLAGAGHAFWSAWQPPDPKKGEPPARRADDRDAGLGPGEGRALRFRVPDSGTTSFTDLVRGEVSVEHADIEDFVLVRANGTPMFLLANAVDDADMAITHVLRGEEHVNGTPKYLLIQAAMGAPRPVFAHLPILVDEQRKKLSKRKHAVAVSDFRARGILPEAMVNYLALLGWGPSDGVEKMDLAQLTAQFDLHEVNSAPAFFDVKKLEAMNGDYLRELPRARFVELGRPFLPDPATHDAFERLAEEAQSRLRRLDELPALFDWVDGPADDPASKERAMKLDVAPQVLDAIIERYAEADWDEASLHEGFMALGPTFEKNPSKLQGPIRVAVTGRIVGLPMFGIFVYLGRDETMARLRKARASLG